jgi:hypothetical protein
MGLLTRTLTRKGVKKMEQIGIFLGEAAEFLGDYWWLWLIAVAICCGKYLGSMWCYQMLSGESFDDDLQDPEPPMLERDLIETCKGAIWFWRRATVAFLSALIVSIGYLFMAVICGG